VDPVRNPYAPGAGQRPPELAGRDRELSQFEVVLERIARGRPERSMVLTGLRGVGKTVLLNSFRSMALQRLWGTGKIEARPEQSIRRPVAGALHMAVRELAPRHRAPDRIENFLAVLKAFAARDPKAGKGALTPHLGIDVPAARGRADSGDLEIDLMELLTDAASVAADLSVGIALFIDEMQDVPAVDISALCAATHELSQNGGPLIVVGAGLPHLPSVLSARAIQNACSGTCPSTGSAGPRRIWRCSRQRSGKEPISSRRRSTRSTRRPTGTRTSSRRTARSPGMSPRPAR
jgi:hypothetical protein